MVKRWHVALSTCLVAAFVFALPRSMLSPETSATLMNQPSVGVTGEAVADDGDITGALPHAVAATTADLKAALVALDNKDLNAAFALAAELDPLQRDIVTFVAIRRGIDGLTPGLIADFARRHPDWPSSQLMRKRAEQSLGEIELQPADVVAAFAGSEPVTEEGRFTLVRAYLALGQRDAAAKLVSEYWRTDTLSSDRDSAVQTQYGDLLTTEDHKARFELLMYADRLKQAGRLASTLGPDYVALAAARASVVRELSDAGKKLDQLGPDARRNPLYAFTLAEWHRKANRAKDAAKALMMVPPELTAAHGDEWWVERRIVSRDLIELGDARTAYQLVSAQQGGDSETKSEAAFHAGWYALRFLGRPDQAIPYFEALQREASIPTTRARAAYWIGRAHEAAGRIKEAREHYRVAATDEATFYGQLALVKLDAASLNLPPLPVPTDEDRASFAQNQLARVLVMLTEAGYSGDAATLYPQLAKQLPSAGQLVLLSEFAEARRDHPMVLAIGKIAAERTLGVERLAFPLEAIPESARKITTVEAAMVYAIARQESAFNPGAVSRAGAMGLLQLLPETASATAKKIGVAFSKDKLTGDPGYNAELGAAHLRDLVGNFNGSYILTFAAYNAGGGKVKEWIRRFGDPRNPDVDPVDWIEMIPYGETRAYVQRVTENLQVYRERLSGAKLGIVDDLKRGS